MKKTSQKLQEILNKLLKKQQKITPSTHKNAKWKGKKSKSWLWV